MSYDPSRFNMTVTLKLPKNIKLLSSCVFNTFISKEVGKENVELLRHSTLSNEWELELKSEAIREKLLRKGKTKVRKWTCWIVPFCTLEVRGYIHWLPNAISNDKVKEFLSQFGEVVFVENYTPQNWDSTIANESRYYALYLHERMRRSYIPHFKKFEDFLCLITVRGRKPACFHCRAWGHKKSQCPTRQIKFNSYCRKPHCSGNDIQNEQESSNVIMNEVETTSDASSSTTSELVNQQVCTESELFVACNSPPMIDSTSPVCMINEAPNSPNFITTASLASQVYNENDLTIESNSIAEADNTSQSCLQNKPTSIISTVCFESEQSSAPNSTITTFIPSEICPENKTSVYNSTTLIKSEVCIENELYAELGSLSTADTTSQVCIDNEDVNNSNTENTTVGASRICSDWRFSDESTELEKQFFLAIHYLGKWKMAMDKIIENVMNTESSA